MLFNYGKCKCLDSRHGNEDAQYTMGDTVLNNTVKEKDLGLTISVDMKVSEQCGNAASKGIGYCIQTWRPYRKKDIYILEKVQRRATNMIQKHRNISYEMRLKECGLTTLETKRLRGYPIEVFILLNRYANIDINIFFHG